MTWPLSLLTSDSNTKETSRLVDKKHRDAEKTDEKNEKSLQNSVISLLRHYEHGLSIPPSARIGDPKLKQKESVPLKLWQLWKYGAFAASKGKSEASFN